ncbi:MAG: Txe/YoeB family addiction module toxin [Gammaproteobacteria bacterium]|nr:Txe/YoeB family addiction module toxin [Gammaproteobacteria bacterium]
MFTVILAKQAVKDAKKLARANLKSKAEQLLLLLQKDPLQNPPPLEKLVSNLAGFYSRRITIQHRLVYEVNHTKKTVHVLRMWSHYE